MTYQLKWNNCAGCMRKRSLLSTCPTYIHICTYVHTLNVHLVMILGAHHQVNQLYQYNIWYMSLCRWPSGMQFGKDRHTKRSPTQSDNWFSWWWTRSCSKHVGNWNKYIEKNCASIWSFTKTKADVTSTIGGLQFLAGGKSLLFLKL